MWSTGPLHPGLMCGVVDLNDLWMLFVRMNVCTCVLRALWKNHHQIRVLNTPMASSGPPSISTSSATETPGRCVLSWRMHAAVDTYDIIPMPNTVGRSLWSG